MRVAEEHRKVVQLPILKGSSIGDAFSGFAPQIEKNAHVGRRVEHAVTAFAAEIRGWEAVTARIGEPAAERLRSQVLERVVAAVESAGGSQVAIAGTAAAPLVTATFGGDEHAMRAVVAAQRVRDVAGRSLHPSMKERFHACIGLNSGTIAQTRVNGSGLEFQASGTIRMFAARLQEFAGPDQIFLSESTYRAVPSALDVVAIGGVRTNGDGEQAEAYCLRGIRPDRTALG